METLVALFFALVAPIRAGLFAYLGIFFCGRFRWMVPVGMVEG